MGSYIIITHLQISRKKKHTAAGDKLRGKVGRIEEMESLGKS